MTIKKSVKSWNFTHKTLADDTGFEPVRPFSLPVFETGTFDHSDNRPHGDCIKKNIYLQQKYWNYCNKNSTPRATLFLFDVCFFATTFARASFLIPPLLLGLSSFWLVLPFWQKHHINVWRLCSPKISLCCYFCGSLFGGSYFRIFNHLFGLCFTNLNCHRVT